MEILHVIESLNPDTGGPAVVALSQAAAEAAKGHRVRLLTRAPSALPETQRLIASIPGALALEILQAPGFALSDMTLACRAFHAIAQADCVHLHGLWEPLLPLVAQTARAYGVPYGITVHGMLAPWSLAQKQCKKRVALTLGYKRMLRLAGFLHCLTAIEREQLGALGLADRAVVIANGVFRQAIYPRPGLAAQLFPALVGRRFVLFMARLHPKKGLDRLISAFALLAERVPDVSIVVCGPDGGAEAAARAQVQALDLSGRVLFLGPVYGAAKSALLADATCFCLPSHQEGFSVAVVEALAFGVPVIITKECCFDAVETAKAGWISEGQPELLSACLLDALGNPGQTRSRGENGRALVLEHFVWESLADQLLAAYASMQPSRPAQSRTNV